MSTVATVGAPKVGSVDPPRSIADVPVVETKMMFEFAASALPALHGRLQKIVGVFTTVSAPHGPEEACPR